MLYRHIAQLHLRECDELSSFFFFGFSLTTSWISAALSSFSTHQIFQLHKTYLGQLRWSHEDSFRFRTVNSYTCPSLVTYRECVSCQNWKTYNGRRDWVLKDRSRDWSTRDFRNGEETSEEVGLFCRLWYYISNISLSSQGTLSPSVCMWCNSPGTGSFGVTWEQANSISPQTFFCIHEAWLVLYTYLHPPITCKSAMYRLFPSYLQNILLPFSTHFQTKKKNLPPPSASAYDKVGTVHE